jgi:hypothetical protein
MQAIIERQQQTQNLQKQQHLLLLLENQQIPQQQQLVEMNFPWSRERQITDDYRITSEVFYAIFGPRARFFI